MTFFERVYRAVKRIPYGKVSSYGKVAEAAGNKRMARQVGWALHSNPAPEEIPCYRVVFKDGRLSSAFAFGGESVQRALLEKEGIKFDEKGRVKPCFFV
ncbi:MAG: MGMT family protein [Christensenellaceae bacterium]